MIYLFITIIIIIVFVTREYFKESRQKNVIKYIRRFAARLASPYLFYLRYVGVNAVTWKMIVM